MHAPGVLHEAVTRGVYPLLDGVFAGTVNGRRPSLDRDEGRTGVRVPAAEPARRHLDVGDVDVRNPLGLDPDLPVFGVGHGIKLLELHGTDQAGAGDPLAGARPGDADGEPASDEGPGQHELQIPLGHGHLPVWCARRAARPQFMAVPGLMKALPVVAARRSDGTYFASIRC